MSSQQIQVRQDPTLVLLAGQEERTPHEWEEQFVDTWLLLEVTAEDEAGEVVYPQQILCATSVRSGTCHVTNCKRSRPSAIDP